MVQVQKNTSPINITTEISSLNAEISKAEVWQATLNAWQNSVGRVPKNHRAWRALSAIYQDFVEADFDKEKGIQLLAEFAKAIKILEIYLPDYQLFRNNSIYQKLFAIWQNLSEEYAWRLPTTMLDTNPKKSNSFAYSSLDRACFDFALVGAEVYAQKFFNLSIKEKHQKILLQNELAQHLSKSWLAYLPKRGAKSKIKADFFWHFEHLLSYFLQTEAVYQKQNTFPSSLVWGKIVQIRQSNWQSLQATLFSPVLAEQQTLTRFQKTAFTLLFSEAKGDFTHEFQSLADQSIWIALLPKNYFQHHHYLATQTAWATHFSIIYQWNLSECELAWVFALKNTKQTSTNLAIHQLNCPKLQSPLSWLALKNIIEGEKQNVLEEVQTIKYSPIQQPTSSKDKFPTYPLLAQETSFGVIGEGIFAHSFEGVALSKQSSLWAENVEKLQKVLPDYLPTHLSPTNNPTLFGVQNTRFDPECVAKIGLCPFQVVSFYAEPSYWAEGAKLAKIFNARQPQVFIHLALHRGALSVWASEYPVSRNFMGRTLSLARQYYEKNREVKDNLRPEALAFFKAYYETRWQDKAATLQWALQALLNLSILEDCQVEPELASEMWVLAQLGESISFAKQLFESINQPNAITVNNFKSLREVFLRTKRSFEQLGKKQSRGKESYDTLKNYFEEGTEAIKVLENFMEEAQQKEINLERTITAQAIFEYTYAALHLQQPSNVYQLKDLHVPLYQDFWAWAEAGAALLALHLQPEAVHKRPMKIQERYLRKGVKQLRVKCLDSENTLLLQDKHIEWQIKQIPDEVFEYFLGNQPALQWVAQALPSQFEIQEENSFFEKYPEAVQQYLQKHIRWIAETVRTKRLLALQLK